MSTVNSILRVRELYGHAIEGLGAISPANIRSVAVLSIVSLAAYIVGLCLYNIFLHPLHRFPGSKLAAITQIPFTVSSLSGRHHRHMLVLHAKYGPIVRVAPRIISIQHANAYPETRGFHKELPKDPVSVSEIKNNIIGANRELHSRYRRILSHGFSPATMLQQEPLIKVYVDKLMSQLRRNCQDGQRPLNMAKWFNYTTFDIIGDLSFGEPFGCLDNESYHPWVALIVHSVANLAWSAHLSRYPLLAPLLRRWVMPKKLADKFADHKEMSMEKVKKRLASGSDRPDFVQKMIEGSKKGSDGMNLYELADHASILIVAGSETTATTLSAATFFLTTHQPVLEKLNAEIRSAFTTEADITMTSTQHLSYLQAVLNESMRCSTATPIGLSRTVQQQPVQVLGETIPVGTIVDTYQYVLNHDPKSFHRAEEFLPERWLGTDPQFANDCLESFHPFSVGPRACIGRNLAVAELRLIMSRLIWNFDLRIDDQSRSFEENSRTYLLWVRPELLIYLTPRKPEVKA